MFSQGALAGIRVLDASQMLAGPQCAMRLGDLGADVLKIEPPQGEWQRSHAIANVFIEGESTGLLGMNRNKRSVAVNLKTDEGRQIFYDLVRVSDVLVQNYRFGVAERLKIDYETLSAINPRLVYCQITGYGEDGPYRDRPGQDLVLQGYSGSMYSVGRKTDTPTPGPIYAMDVMTSYQATIGILSALLSRSETGRGQKVSVNMFATALDAQQQEISTYLNAGMLPPRTEEPLANAWINAPYGVYKTKDSYMTLAMAPLDVLGEALDNDFLRGLTDWSAGAIYRDEIYRAVEAALPTRTTAEWIEHFDRYNIWSGPVYDYADVERDPHVMATNMIVEVPHPKINHLRMPNVPINMSETPASIRRHPPMLGEHTDEVLREVLGYDEARIRALEEKSVIRSLASEGVV
jgi:crotonobetainyl-CoA:carnitine CoA-transferase CaiB-like acyl-CoA transferase